MTTITLYADGACSGNPGPGGWGVVLLIKNKEYTLSGGAPMTTNNKMELKAALEGLEFIAQRYTDNVTINLYTDSQYVQKGMTSWLNGWKRNNWKNAQKQPVKNRELWEALDSFNQQYLIHWHWIKGHAGHIYNEKADQLARQAIDQNKS